MPTHSPGHAPLDIFEALLGLLQHCRQEMMLRVERRQPGLSFLEMRILMMAGEKAGISQKELVERTLLDKAQMARSLANLEASGFIERRPSDEDRRVRCLYLSALGRTLYEGLQSDHREVTEALFGDWPEEAAAALLDAAAAFRRP